jgi:hypothetical protein
MIFARERRRIVSIPAQRLGTLRARRMFPLIDIENQIRNLDCEQRTSGSKIRTTRGGGDLRALMLRLARP